MKGWLVILLALWSSLALGQTAPGAAQRTGNTGDEAAIRRILADTQRGWETLDASLVAANYGADADYTNAYGQKVQDKADIATFFAKLFTSPIMKNRTTMWHEPLIRFVRPDVAIVSQPYESLGQKTADGQEVPKRMTHSMRVLTKEQGTWWTVSHQVMDQRER